MELTPPLLLLLLFCLLYPTTTSAATQDVEIRVEGVTYFATFAAFGSYDTITGTLAVPPPTIDPLLCEGDYGDVVWTGDIMLVPRGECTFALKAFSAQQMGATGIIIYNTLESRYGWNDTVMKYPEAKSDYECANGRSDIDSLTLDPPAYNGSVHDAYLTFSSPDNLCLVDNPSQCESKKCLVTGPADGNGIFEGCCAWDIHMRMGGNASFDEEVNEMVAVYITMRQADDFLSFPQNTLVTIEKRPNPRFNVSAILLWMLATFIVGFAAWYSAKDYRKAKKEWLLCLRSTIDGGLRPRLGQDVSTAQNEEAEDAVNPETSTIDFFVDTPQENDAETASRDEEVTQDSLDPETLPAIASTQIDVPPRADETPDHDTNEAPQQHEETIVMRPSGSHSDAIELSAWHAVAFIVVASTLLLVLFYFQVYTWVTVLYGIGCSGAISQLIFSPAYRLMSRQIGLHKCCFSPISSTTFCGLSEIQWVDVIAGMSGYLVGAMWLYVAFTDDDPSTNVFFWMTQDVMGACLSILFLSLLTLNSIKVATILLVATFLYDIFFVFISPFIFDKSVMVTVATSGGTPEGSQDFCEKYPDDGQCQGGDPLPLLLTIPRIMDYHGGSSLLGLGDIVIPGLLLAFAARLDEAKRLVGSLTNRDSINVPKHWYNGYLCPLVLAYAIGLLMANIAVVLMERGQPALLYLVPACLGTMFFIGRKELGELWRGPEVIRMADRIVQHRPEILVESQLPDNPEETSQEARMETGSTRSIL
jgi:cytoskeletal protein RodZ